MEVTSTDLATLLIEKIHIKREHVTTFLGVFINEVCPLNNTSI